MKTKWLKIAIVAAFACVGVAHASDSPIVKQETATIYGRVDGGVGYINYQYYQPNEQKGFRLGTAGHAWQLESGANQSNLFGFKGSIPLFEDLDGVYQFEGTFNNIKLRYDGGLFGLNAYVGVVSPSWGSLLTGWQKSVSDDFFNAPFSNFAFNQMPSDNVEGLHGDVFGNAAGWPGAGFKYLSPLFNGFHFGASLAYGLSFKTEENTADASLKPQGNFIHGALAFGYEQGPWKAAATYDFYSPLGQSAKVKAEHAYTLSLNYKAGWGRMFLAGSQAFAPSAYAFGQYAHVGAALASNATDSLTYPSPQFGDPRYPGSHVAVSKDFVNSAVALGAVVNLDDHQQIYAGYSFGYAKADLTFKTYVGLNLGGSTKKQQGGGSSSVTDSSKKNEHIDDSEINSGGTSTGTGSGTGPSMYTPRAFIPNVVTLEDSTDSSSNKNLTAETDVSADAWEPHQFRALTNLFRVGYVFNFSAETAVYVYGGYGWVTYQKRLTGVSSSYKTTTRLTLQQFGLGITQSF